MSSNKLIDIEINNENKVKVILLNILKMLKNRDIIDEDKIDDHYNKLLQNLNNDNKIFKIYSDKLKKNIFIKFLYISLTTIRKNPLIDEFFVTAKDGDKIIIVRDLKGKAYKQFLEYANTEIFWEEEFMINLVDHHIVPKHIVLNEKDRNEFYNSYQVKKNNLPRMFNTDPVARYYNMEVGDIVKIERYSIASGIDISYRIVVPGSLSIFK